MKYDYQYDIACIIAAVFLLTIYIIRRTYKTKSNMLLLLLIANNIFTASMDLTSVFCIASPEKFPMWFNSFTTLGYVYCYNMMAVLLFAFMDSKTKIVAMWKPTKIICVTIAIVELIIMATSPWTHLICYFDEDMNYQHGPMMNWLYVVAAGLLFGGCVMFYIARRRFNKYQVFAVVSFIVALFTGVVVQALIPKLLIGSFSCTLVLYFLYTALENPVKYAYRDTTCLNRRSFLETMKNVILFDENVSLVAFSIKDYGYVKQNVSLKNLERLSSNIADFIHYHYKTNGYCIADDKFVIILRDKKDADFVKRQITMFFQNPINLINSEISLSVNQIYVEDVDTSLTMDAIEDGINYLLENGDETEVDFKTIVKRLRRKQEITHIIKETMDADGFDVYFQPIRNVKTGKFTNVEALIRLFDEEYGFISPEEFIPIAENEGNIYTIGEMVFTKVCKFLKESHCIDFGVEYIEINLSPLQCFQENLVEKFTEIMKEYEIDPKWINLEITESAEISSGDRMTQNINAFSDMGITFSLDDYGSGFASADYLFSLPVDIVKIDKSILWQAMKDEKAMIVLKNTMQMVKELGKEIVVEGVENQKMVDVLTEMGCDFMQGYFYSKPIPSHEYLEFIKENN